MGASLFLVLLAQVSGGTLGIDRVDLAAAAAASPRPEECGSPLSKGALWERAATPAVERYCTRLAHGYSVLAESPDLALAAAAAAERALGGRSAPLVLEARALTALRKHREAWERFAKAKQIGAAVRAPGALHALALAAVHTGQEQAGLAAYRALVPRAGLVDDAWRRQTVYLEAATWAMNGGASRLDEAIGTLTEARRRGSPPGFADTVAGALALALDRQGRADEAMGVAASTNGPWGLVRWVESSPPGEGDVRPHLPPGEFHAIVAIVAERSDPDLAREHWRAYVDARKEGPFVSHAQAKLDKRARVR